MKTHWELFWYMSSAVWGILFLVRSFKKDSPDRDARSERALLLAVAYLILANTEAQDSRWRLIHGTDSIVAVPLQDLRTAAGLRVAKNFQARQCAWELAERGKEIAALRSAIEHGRVAAKLNAQLVTSQSDEIALLANHNRKLARKVKRRNPAMWMGIGAGIVVLVQTQMR